MIRNAIAAIDNAVTGRQLLGLSAPRACSLRWYPAPALLGRAQFDDGAHGVRSNSWRDPNRRRDDPPYNPGASIRMIDKAWCLGWKNGHQRATVSRVVANVISGPRCPSCGDG